MPKYTIRLAKKAEKQLDKLSNHIALPLFEVIQKLAEDPYPSGCKKLKNRDGYRVRKGDYRIIYEVFDSFLLVDIVAIGHRKNIYTK